MPQRLKDTKVHKTFIHNVKVLVQLGIFELLYLIPFHFRLKDNFRERVYSLKIVFIFNIVFPGIFFSAHAQTHDLNFYLNVASSNSPLLKDYQNQIKSGKIDSLLIKAANRPEVLANGSVMIAPVINGYGYDEAITDGAHYTGVVSVSQPLFNKAILKPQYRQIEIQNLTIANNAKISRLGLNKNITNQYLTAYAGLQQLRSNKEVWQLLQKQQEILKRLVQQGVYKETDYLTFLTALQSQEVSVKQLQLQYKNDLSMLNYLSGIQDTSTVTLAAPSMDLRYHVTSDSSIFLRQYILDSLRIKNQRSLLDVQYKPTIDWFADAGLNSSVLDQVYHYFGASFGINFLVPIYDGKQRDLKYQQFKIAEQTREYYADFYHHQYNQQLAMLMQQLHGTNQLIQTIQEKLKTLQLLLKVDQRLLNTGGLHITDYMLAINNYLTIKSNLSQAKVNRYQIINQLNYWDH